MDFHIGPDISRKAPTFGREILSEVERKVKALGVSSYLDRELALSIEIHPDLRPLLTGELRAKIARTAGLSFQGWDLGRHGPPISLITRDAIYEADYHVRARFVPRRAPASNSGDETVIVSAARRDGTAATFLPGAYALRYECTGPEGLACTWVSLIRSPEVTVGRSALTRAVADTQIAVPTSDRGLSREHFKLNFRNAQWNLQALHETGIWVNGVHRTGGFIGPVNIGDQMEVPSQGDARQTFHLIDSDTIREELP